MVYQSTKRVERVPLSGIRKIAGICARLQEEGKDVVDFSIGQPDFDTPAYIKNAAAQALAASNCAYTHNLGLLSLRKTIAQKLQAENNLTYNPQNEIMVTVGGQEALAAAILAFLDEGDEAIILDPYYPPFKNLVQMSGAKAVIVPTKRFQDSILDIEALESAVTDRTKLLIFNSPCNPSGVVYPQEDLSKLAAFAEEHNLLVISDEAYEKMLYNDVPYTSIASVDNMRRRTVVIRSFSKTYSMTGWRVGFAAAPDYLMNSMLRIHQALALCTSSVSQHSALAALNGPQKDMEDMINEFARRRTLFIDAFERLNIPCVKPQGAFYFFPDMKEFSDDSWKICTLLLEQYGIAAVPGIEFGLYSKSCIRISYAISYERCVEGISRLTQAIEDFRNGKTIIATD